MKLDLKKLFDRLKEEGIIKEEDINKNLKVLLKADRKTLENFLSAKLMLLPQSIRYSFISKEDYKKLLEM